MVCDGNAIYRCGEDNLWSEIPRDELVLEASEVAPGAAQCERISDYKAIAQLAGMLLTETEFFKDAPWGFASLSHFYRAEGKVLVKEPLAPEHRQRFKLDFDPEPDCPTPSLTPCSRPKPTGRNGGGPSPRRRGQPSPGASILSRKLSCITAKPTPARGYSSAPWRGFTGRRTTRRWISRG